MTDWIVIMYLSVVATIPVMDFIDSKLPRLTEKFLMALAALVFILLLIIFSFAIVYINKLIYCNC